MEQSVCQEEVQYLVCINLLKTLAIIQSDEAVG